MHRPLLAARCCRIKTYHQESLADSPGCAGRAQHSLEAFFAPKHFYYVARHSNDKSVGLEVGAGWEGRGGVQAGGWGGEGEGMEVAEGGEV